MTKEEVFTAATAEHKIKEDWARIPDGRYYLSQTVKGYGKVTATMLVSDGELIVEKGSTCAPAKGGWLPEARKNAQIKDNVLLEATQANSPSTAGWIVLGHSNNGWSVWKDEAGQPIDIYRK